MTRPMVQSGTRFHDVLHCVVVCVCVMLMGYALDGRTGKGFLDVGHEIHEQAQWEPKRFHHGLTCASKAEMMSKPQYETMECTSEDYPMRT